MREIDAPDVVTRLGQHLSLSQLDGFEMLVEASEVNVGERLQELIGLGHGQSYCVRPSWQAALGRSGQICAHHPGLDAETEIEANHFARAMLSEGFKVMAGPTYRGVWSRHRKWTGGLTTPNSKKFIFLKAVSYTHLTLPTKRI